MGTRDIVSPAMEHHQSSVQRGVTFQTLSSFQPLSKSPIVKFMVTENQKDQLESNSQPLDECAIRVIVCEPSDVTGEYEEFGARGDLEGGILLVYLKM